jgi:hypothetical protein
LAIGAPVFPSVKLNRGRNSTVISAPGAAPGKYIQALTINGKPTQQTSLDSLATFTHLRFNLSDQPDKSWGSTSPPPSYPAGPVKFPPGLTPVELTTAGNTTVTAGAQANADLTLTIGAGAEKPVNVRSITWRAEPVGGLSVTPKSGTVQVAPDGTARLAATVSATPDAKQGFGAIPITLTSDPAVSLPRLEFPVAVIGPGKTAKVCTTLGTTNADHGLTQRELAGDGVTTPVTAGGKEARKTVLRVPNNLNMYFRVDRRLAHDGLFTATFDITYFDTGTNGWTLQYDSVEHPYKGAITISNQGSDTWKTISVTVTDAKFAERQNEQTDFRIASPSPVTIHSVQTTITGDGVLPMDLCG